MAKKILLFGGGGRVGLQIVGQLTRAGFDLAVADLLPEPLLRQRVTRTRIDAQLSSPGATGAVAVYGGIDVLDRGAVESILVAEQPDLVINYAIPITWDATKRLPNYSAVSRAGLGAFTPIQLCAPRVVGEAIANSGADPLYMVGNLPDITIPVLTAYAKAEAQARPICGAGNVGLIEAAVRSQVAAEQGIPLAEVQVSLVAHHIHWVAPREPGYANDAPFLLKLEHVGEDITADLGDARGLMNRAISACYESDAGFSSTTGILAGNVAAALLDEDGRSRRMHVPAPNGLCGGYPVTVSRGSIDVELPWDWSAAEADAAMREAQRRDGLDRIDGDGTVHFAGYAREVLRQELGFELPAAVSPGDMAEVGRAQIECLEALFGR